MSAAPERYRQYLLFLAEVQLDADLRGRIDLEGVLRPGLRNGT